MTSGPESGGAKVRGAPRVVKRFRRFWSGMSSLRSRPAVRVAGRGDVEAQHHGVVFVDHVVAVHGIASQPVPGAHLHLHVAAGDEAYHVLARGVHAAARAAASAPAVLAAPAAVVAGVVVAAPIEAWRALGDLELLQVHVDGMGPPEAAVEVPLLEAVLLDLEADGVAVEQLPVDGPLSVPRLVEVERAADERRTADARQGVVGGEGGGIDAVVGDRRAVDDDPQHEETLSSGDDAAARASLAVRLIEAVLEVERLPGVLREVDDHVRPLGDSQRDGGDLDRLWQQVAV